MPFIAIAWSYVWQNLERQRGHLLPWAPVFFAIGILIYFNLRFEPKPLIVYTLCVLLVFITALFWHRKIHSFWVFFLVAFMLIALGFTTILWRAHNVAAPVLKNHYQGTIEGRIIKIDKSFSNKPRLTLDNVVLDGIAPALTPSKVRVSLHHDDIKNTHLIEGLNLRIIGYLSPPSGSTEPNGFDFKRYAWFQGIGAMGYSRNVPEIRDRDSETYPIFIKINRIRHHIGRWLLANMPKQTAPFGVAIITGDRSFIESTVIDNLRKTNLSHLLAISGLHMGLLTGLVFMNVRLLWNFLLPHTNGRIVKKVAAVCALACAFVYLLFSGGNVATERAFIMVSVIMVAVLLDRQALSLRSVGLAALIILLHRPESVINPGFQMSFSATIALITGFQHLKKLDLKNKLKNTKWLEYIFILLFSSFIAGLATAPFSIAHFNQYTTYGLIANMLSVPLMGMVIIPGALLAAILYPFGLSAIGFWFMNLGISWILGVAAHIGQIEGATYPIVTPYGFVLGIVALSFLFLTLWQGKGRFIGVFGFIVAFAFWINTERPLLLISETGGLIGKNTPYGRVLNKESGDGFTAIVWLENDGDRANQKLAAQRQGFQGNKTEKRFSIGRVSIVHLSGKNIIQIAEKACAQENTWVITAAVLPKLKGDCLLFDAKKMKQLGAVAISLDSKGNPVIKSAQQKQGQRLWTNR